MLDIANILALSKLRPETPDEVRKAATLMILGGKTSPLISGIASANIVEEATKSAEEATSATKAKTVAEKRTTVLEEEINVIRPLVNEVGRNVEWPAMETGATAEQNDGYARTVAALKTGMTVEAVLARLARPAGGPATIQPMKIEDVSSAEDSIISALTDAAKAIKSTSDNQITEERQRKAGVMLSAMLGLKVEAMEGLNTVAKLKKAIKDQK